MKICISPFEFFFLCIDKLSYIFCLSNGLICVGNKYYKNFKINRSTCKFQIKEKIYYKLQSNAITTKSREPSQCHIFFNYGGGPIYMLQNEAVCPPLR